MSDKEPGAALAREAIEDKAIEWVIRMRGDDAADLAPRFAAWLAASPEHRAAHAWAEAHLAGAARLKQSQRHGLARFVTSRRWQLTAAAAAVALLLLFQPRAFFGPFQDSETARAAQRLETPHGEIRTYDLSDGSKVTLDSASSIDVAMTLEERRVKLREGKARFTIVPDRRPFVVEAGSGSVRSEEGVIDVGYQADAGRIEVNLLSGRAGLQPTADSGSGSEPLAPGRGVQYPARDFRPALVAGTGIDRRDWPTGWVNYHSVPLRELVAEANRYAPLPIRIDGAAVGDLNATGRFKLTDTDAFVGRIAALFDLEVSSRDDGIHLRRR